MTLRGEYDGDGGITLPVRSLDVNEEKKLIKSFIALETKVDNKKATKTEKEKYEKIEIRLLDVLDTDLGQSNFSLENTESSDQAEFLFENSDFIRFEVRKNKFYAIFRVNESILEELSEEQLYYEDDEGRRYEEDDGYDYNND